MNSVNVVKAKAWVGVGFVLVLAGCAEEKTRFQKMSAFERSRMFVELANGALLDGDATGALQHLKQAEDEDDSLPELHHSRALALLKKRDLKAAIISAKRAVEIMPNYPDANNTLGKLLIDDGKYEEAKKPLKTAANNRLYREAYKAWTNLGILEFRQGNFLKAESYFDRAIQESDTLSCIAYHYRGIIKQRTNRNKSGIQDYRYATQRYCHAYTPAFFALARAYERIGATKQAKTVYLDLQKRYEGTETALKAIDELRRLP